jgi:Chaperone of endosialidase
VRSSECSSTINFNTKMKIRLTKTIPSITNSLNRATARRDFPVIALSLAWFGLAAAAHAQTCPSLCYDFNTALGYDALFSNTTGNYNTANGVRALAHNTTGRYNTATGANALYRNTTGSNNTANGNGALFDNNGNNNTAIGYGTLVSNTTGNDNTANGFQALFNNATGSQNTANGLDALNSNTTGSDNTANGVRALWTNTTGRYNTANGLAALRDNTTGDYNIALGFQAGLNITTGSNNIDIGNSGVASDSSTVRIGAGQTRTFIAGIHGKRTGDVSSTTAVVIDMNGNLGTTASSQRFKKDIGPMDKASEVVLALKPVTFHYKDDAKGIPQFGLVAEEVEKVNPALVVRDAKGEVYTVRYEAVNAMLLNEFLKEHSKVEEQDCKLHAQGATIAELKKQVAALTAGLQKVSAQLEVNTSAPQTVRNND